MNWKQLFQTLDSLIDSNDCMEKVAGIYENDRWFSSDKNVLTAHYCAETFRNAGLDQVELLPLAADARTKYFDWGIAKAWDAEYGILQYTDGQVICDYHQMPCSLVMYCPSTPAEGIEAEVIEICGELPTADLEEESVLTKYQQKYAGKVLLTSQTAYKGVAFAEKVNAVGVLSDFISVTPGVRSREDLHDECTWMGMGSDNTSTVFAFHLTPDKADDMRARLSQGSVRVLARVSTRSYDGTSYTVSAALTGTEPDLPELLTYGHLYEPGANDNASGAGAILSLAGALNKAVCNGILPRPKRTIRFVIGAECGGSMGYLASHPDYRALCGIVPDMIGAEDTDNAVMSLRYNPISNWSFADAAVWALSKIAREYYRKEIPYIHMAFDIGTDNIIADPSFGIPTIAMVAAPALSYHCSKDRVDRVDSETLKRNTLIFGTYLFGLADADEETCQFLKQAIQDQIGSMLNNTDDPRTKAQLLDAQGRALKSLPSLLNQPTTAPLLTSAPMPDYAAETGIRIPVRTMKSTLNFNTEFKGKTWSAAWSNYLNTPYFWTDGQRTFWEVVYQSSVELGFTTDEQLKAEYENLSDYFECLEELGFIKWREH